MPVTGTRFERRPFRATQGGPGRHREKVAFAPGCWGRGVADPPSAPNSRLSMADLRPLKLDHWLARMAVETGNIRGGHA